MLTPFQHEYVSRQRMLPMGNVSHAYLRKRFGRRDSGRRNAEVKENDSEYSNNMVDKTYIKISPNISSFLCIHDIAKFIFAKIFTNGPGGSEKIFFCEH